MFRSWLFVVLSVCILRARAATFTASVGVTATNTLLNHKVLGSNIQWIDEGDNLIYAPFSNTSYFNPSYFFNATSLKPTVIRYPGGVNADYFHWQDSLDPNLSLRGVDCNGNTPDSTQKVYFGLQEFMETVEASGGQALLQVNIVTGTPEEAAAWVHYVNIQRMTSRRTGQLLPKVTYWEIGNEPYLTIGTQSTAFGSITFNNPHQVANVTSHFIRAMKAVDSTIQCGIVIASDTLNGQSTSQYPNFQDIMFSEITVAWDFTSKHNTYMPGVFTGSPSDHDLYYASMGAVYTVGADFDYTHTRAAALSQFPSTFNAPFAITEYALLALQPYAFRFTTSFLSALYALDVVIYFLNRNDVLMANYWSLTGNGYFGTMFYIPPDYHTDFRPVFWAFSELAKVVLTPESLANPFPPTAVPQSQPLYKMSLNINSPTFAVPSLFFVAPQSAVPNIVAIASHDGVNPQTTIRLLVVNKHMTDSATVTVEFAFADSGLSWATSIGGSTVSVKELYTPDPMSMWQYYTNSSVLPVAWSTPVTTTLPSNSSLTLQMKPHSAQSIVIILPVNDNISSGFVPGGPWPVLVVALIVIFALN